MYGQGPYAPQIGQSPNRPPRPPFMQQQISHASALAGLIQQRPSVSPHAVAQPVGQQAHAISQVDSAYYSAPISQSLSSTSMPRTGQFYPPQATTGQNSTTVMNPFLSAQQGAQSGQYFPPSSHSRLPPPPPSQNQNLYRHPIHQPLPNLQQITLPHSALPLPPPPPMLPLQTSTVPPLPPSPPPFPPPPPPSSTLQPSPPISPKTINSGHVQSVSDPCFTQAVTPESVQNIVTHDTNRGSDPNDASVEGGFLSMSSDTVDVPTPPPRPTNEKTLRNIEILCQYISQNGPAFEDMARQKESGNLAFQFLFGGEPGSEAAAEREYYLWMKNKLGSGQSKSNLLVKDKHDENRSSVEPNKEVSYPVTDSDMEMEDDIMQACEETVVHDQVSGLKHEFVSAMDDIEKNDQNNLLHTSTIYMGPAINVGGDDGGRSNQNIGIETQTEEPFRLLKDYSSDESSEFDALEPVSPLQLHEPIAVASDQCKMQELGHSDSHMIGALCKQPKDLDAAVAPKISANELIPGPSSLDKKSDIADESKQSDYHDLEERDALESSCVNLISGSGKDQRERTKSSAFAKVDEFGRLIREGASETDSDDSRHYRRLGRRGRSRSPSRSPPKRRRRSPWRRKERRSLSRSWSPKRWRSSCRSPLRRPIDSGSQKNSRGRHQMGECFNFLKGRCYRGASCKYLHNDPDKYSESRQHRSKYNASETRTSSRDYDHSEENKVTIKESSLDEIQNDKIKDGDLKANQKQHPSKGSIVDEKDRAGYMDGSRHHVEASSPCLPNNVSHSENVSDLFNSNLQKDKKPEDVQISAISSCLPTEAVVSPCKKDLLTSISSAFNYPNHVSQLQQPLHLQLPPPPPPPPSMNAASIPRIPQPMQFYSSVPSEHQQTQFHPQQNLPWGNFPPQRPPYIPTPPIQQGSLPVRFDLLMQSSLNIKPADLPIHPQVGNLQGSYISMQGSHQPPRHHLGQPVAGSLNSTSATDDPFINPLSSGPFPSSSLPHANIPPRPVSSHENLPSGEPSSSGFQNPPFLQQQQQPYGFYQAAGLHITADLHQKNPSHVSDTGSRITAHYNPYASTFDQPLGSKFSSDVFKQGNKTSGSEYDPLFDSIEPSAESLKKQTVQEDCAADNSDIMLRLSKVKGKKKVVGADSAATSSETDEFGETAHPEVIVVEAGSQSNLNDSAEGSAGDVEINQVKREGKSKKNKDSRSMKLFRLALASFVKDMLKPSWRQGNMSKEAFKTIVKKTVEKVSGAMKGHRVPKSKAKIDQYINRSQRKLTALVEGYVNKYAK